MLELRKFKDRTEVTFVLDAVEPPGPVSVVGDFNNWQPCFDTLFPRDDGMRAVTVTLPPNSVHSFRYLAAEGHWFDDERPDSHDGRNGAVHT